MYSKDKKQHKKFNDTKKKKKKKEVVVAKLPMFPPPRDERLQAKLKRKKRKAKPPPDIIAPLSNVNRIHIERTTRPQKEVSEEGTRTCLGKKKFLFLNYKCRCLSRKI